MPVGFDFRDQINSPSWPVARQAVLDQFDALIAALNASPGVAGSATANTVLSVNNAGTVDFRLFGVWTSAPFSASDYVLTKGGGSWVVTPGTNTCWQPLAYTVIGSTMIITVDVEQTALTISSTPAVLGIRIPGAYQATNRNPSTAAFPARNTEAVCHVVNNSTTPNGLLRVAPNSLYLEIVLPDTNFVTSSDFSVRGQIAFEIQPQ